MRLTTWLGACVVFAALHTPGFGQMTGPAPGCCGGPPVHDPSLKSMIGTAVNAPASLVYFTGFQGEASEIYYPTVDTLASANLEFLVGDANRSFLDEEKLQSWTVTRPDPKSMRWQAVTSNAGHNWRIVKTIFADPANSTLIQRTTFETLNGKRVGDFNLYLLYKPYLNNAAANNSAKTTNSGGRTYLTATSGDGTKASALASSLGWTASNNTTMVSNGYYGVNDGWQDLFVDNPTPFAMRSAYDSAANGNVAQIGWLNLAGVAATSIAFDVAIGFGASEAAAIAAASATLGEDLAAQQQAYDNAWRAYAAGLSDQNGTADDQYYLSAMALKSAQDKTNGAIVAGMGTPWGGAAGDGSLGYHLVWPRDMFKFANALITAGDAASAASAVGWLFGNGIEPGENRFPQNAFVSGAPFWNGVQMDEQALPIVLAYRLGPAVYNPLWPRIKTIANYILANGPRTQQERWEENDGYSPSTIAAEIAGLVDAAQIARENGDAADAGAWLNAADYWQQNVVAWTYTTQGCPNAQSYCGLTSTYIRINPSPARGGALPGGWNPTDNPNPNLTLAIKNNGGLHRAVDIVDGGFLELVRLGVKAPNDPTIALSLATYDATIEETIGAGAPAWFRYNFDGYGETNDGGPFQGWVQGRGKLWPIFDAERGNYQIAATGAGAAGAPYLAALKGFSTPQGFLPEQVWSPCVTLPADMTTAAGWHVADPAGGTPGAATGSMAPLNWAEGEYINLLADIAANKALDIPPAVCSRYHACILPPAAGQVEVDLSVNALAAPGQYLYVTGDAEALGGWNVDFGLPVDPASYPIWKTSLNLPAGGAVQYKYYRKNADGGVTRECYPGNGACGGNRLLALPASGDVPLADSVSWN